MAKTVKLLVSACTTLGDFTDLDIGQRSKIEFEWYVNPIMLVFSLMWLSFWFHVGSKQWNNVYVVLCLCCASRHSKRSRNEVWSISCPSTLPWEKACVWQRGLVFCMVVVFTYMVDLYAIVASCSVFSIEPVVMWSNAGWLASCLVLPCLASGVGLSEAPWWETSLYCILITTRPGGWNTSKQSACHAT